MLVIILGIIGFIVDAFRSIARFCKWIISTRIIKNKENKV